MRAGERPGVGSSIIAWRLTVVIIGNCILQNLFNGSESFRTDSASPTCTSHESMEGSQDYDAVEKGESPRSNNSQDPRDLRRKLGSTYIPRVCVRVRVLILQICMLQKIFDKEMKCGAAFWPFLIEIFSVFVSIQVFCAILTLHWVNFDWQP